MAVTPAYPVIPLIAAGTAAAVFLFLIRFMVDKGYIRPESITKPVMMEEE